MGTGVAGLGARSGPQTLTMSSRTTTTRIRICHRCAVCTTRRNLHARVQPRAIARNAQTATGGFVLVNLIPSKSKGKAMKVLLMQRTGQNEPGSELDLSEPEARWLIDQGRAKAVGSASPEREPEHPSAPGGSGEPDAPRRGRPPRAGGGVR